MNKRRGGFGGLGRWKKKKRKKKRREVKIGVIEYGGNGVHYISDER